MEEGNATPEVDSTAARASSCLAPSSSLSPYRRRWVPRATLLSRVFYLDALAYAIGVKDPLSVLVTTEGTGLIPDEQFETIAAFRPADHETGVELHLSC